VSSSIDISIGKIYYFEEVYEIFVEFPEVLLLLLLLFRESGDDDYSVRLVEF
jgi:hypothetical protein